MKKIKSISILILSLILALSCSDDDRQEIENEFANLPFVVGFDRTSDSYVFLPADTTPINESVFVTLSSGPNGLYSDEDITVRYELDATTNAILGTEFQINNTSDSFTIPAGREVATTTLDYTIFPENLPFDEQKSVMINLISEVEGVSAGEQFATVEILFERCAPPLVGSFTAANTVNGSSNGDGESVNIVALECDTYRADNLPNFNGVFSWDFVLNADDTITIIGTLGDFSNVVSGSGVLLPNGTIQINNMDVEAAASGMSFDLIPN
ncbi:hypothetical protein [Winogradskyella haliclonae]|uniref:DUF1735 domain-containing protein n=1 Tax=Winogradskyella haliclonae TaxID=2048558 RepID=A0ABQ2C0L7_9FLAO|nr:hypothetical protein [Winogradskyella haliclonae]GGI58292.1 hypothetical protein GCM10011444_26010 [Winogradskyella haliclonae]